MNSVVLAEVKRLYIDEDLSMRQVADVLGVSVGYIHKTIHKNKIPAKPRYQPEKTPIGKPLDEEHKQKLVAAHKGKKLSKEQRAKISEMRQQRGIGHKKKRVDGYITIYFPDHPKSASDGYIMEHILVMEAVIGRHLREDECVHHINKKRDDNRAKNLKLMTKSEHMSYHSTKRHQERRGDLSTR